MEDVQKNAKALAESADGLVKQCDGCEGEGDRKACVMGPMANVGAAAKSLAEATDISSARTEFGKLSENLVKCQTKHEGEDSGGLPVFKCDMAKKVWIQKDEALGNPYCGPSMEKCGQRLD